MNRVNELLNQSVRDGIRQLDKSICQLNGSDTNHQSIYFVLKEVTKLLTTINGQLHNLINQRGE